MLLRLACRGEMPGVAHSVVSLMGEGSLADSFRSGHVPCTFLDMPRGSVTVTGVGRLVKVLRSLHPDVVHCWMYHANLLGGLAARLAGSSRIVWSIHHCSIAPEFTKGSTLLVNRLCGVLSRWIPTSIVYCSERARTLHASLGYDGRRARVVPNGFDTSVFAPNEPARVEIRKEWGAEDGDFMVGLIGRFDPAKNIQGYCRALGLVARRVPSVRGVLVGEGLDASNRTVQRWFAEAGISGRCLLGGRRGDIQRVLCGLDCFVLSSDTESFPNVVGEAMASALPCVVTGVGDVAAMIGETGVVVPPQDPSALAQGILEMSELSAAARRDLGERARARVSSLYDLRSIARRYGDIYGAN